MVFHIEEIVHSKCEEESYIRWLERILIIMQDSEKQLIVTFENASSVAIQFIGTLKADKVQLQADKDALTQQVADLQAQITPDAAFDQGIVDATNSLAVAATP